MNKKTFGIGALVLFFLLFLKAIHVLQGRFASTIVIVIFTLTITSIIVLMERHNLDNAQQKKLNYENLDVARYLCAIVVIILHVRPFVDISTPWDIAFTNIVSRICVPLFFITTGYFVAKKETNNPNYIKTYLRSMLPIYFVWSLLYIPFGLDYIQELEVPLYQYPFALIIAFFYTGMYYHLWYFPALLVSLYCIRLWKAHFSMKWLFYISFVLLCLGATETYYGLLPSAIQSLLTDYYFNIFYTTRNFLFFGLFYVVMGYVIGQKKDAYVSYSFLKFLICTLLLIGEVILLQTTQRLDSNILIFCVPLVYYLFNTLLYSSKMLRIRIRYPLRELYKYYYFLHPIIIFLVPYLASLLNSNFFFNHKLIELALVLLFTHLISILILEIKKKFPKLII